MKLDIKIISKKVITPSSPTPLHLRNHSLSFLDQIMPPHLSTAYFIYPPNNNQITNFQKSTHLKKSLSKALTLFYPLAGRRRVDDNSYINCNDEGVTYVEARANRGLSDVITDPNPEDFCMLLPCDPVDSRDVCLVVQVTFFSCGGLVLGLGISHKVGDGLSIIMFLNSWAAFARGDSRVKAPIFESSVLFQPKDSVRVREIAVLEKKENIDTKRFVFTSKMISKLREKYTNKGLTRGLTRLTRIETLSAFIGNRFHVSTITDDYVNKVKSLRIFVDIRTRVVPPLSQSHFGNIVVPGIITLPSSENDEDSTDIIIKKMRDAICNVNGDSVAELRQQNESPLSDAVMLSFTNLCSFPSHKVNFGWGVPMLIGGPNHPVNNMVFFNNSLSGGAGDIDVWVNLKKEDMAKFEVDEDLLKYVSCGDDTKFISKM